MTYVAGQKVRAADLNASLPLIGRATSDITVNNTTTQINATGLVIPLEANGVYAFDGWIYYESNPTADIKFGVTGPSGYSAVMSWRGPPIGTAPVTGQERINYTDMGAFAPGNYALGGDDEFTGSVWITAEPKGIVTCGSTAGSFQVIFAQNTANASNTRVKAGSWIRAFRMA